MEAAIESDKEEEDGLLPGEVVVKLYGVGKAMIRASWNSALIVKVFGKMVGYH